MNENQSLVNPEKLNFDEQTDSESESEDAIERPTITKANSRMKANKKGLGFTKPKGNNDHKNNNPKRANFEEKTWPLMREKYKEISRLINEDEWNPGNLESLCKIFNMDNL